MNILVTGGAGFIGSAVVRYLVGEVGQRVLNIDSLTYAGNLNSLGQVSASADYMFSQTDIRDTQALSAILEGFAPDRIMHLAAESHVDRSIDGPADFIQTNVVGTLSLLEAARGYWNAMPRGRRQAFRFHHVSTDEVYGDLGPDDALFTEATPYQPSSPYSASKAASDHLVRAWHRTYGLPVVVSNCSNNYGPFQFPEKMIPHMILNALAGEPLPVYGDGLQIRDWLHVEDHARALWTVCEHGQVGRTYNVGGDSERTNIAVIRAICDALQQVPDLALDGFEHFSDLITTVEDRPGHDRRYAIDNSRIQSELGWSPRETFESGLEKTIRWYLDNRKWWEDVLSGEYRLSRIGKSGNAHA